MRFGSSGKSAPGNARGVTAAKPNVVEIRIRFISISVKGGLGSGELHHTVKAVADSGRAFSFGWAVVVPLDSIGGGGYYGQGSFPNLHVTAVLHRVAPARGRGKLDQEPPAGEMNVTIDLYNLASGDGDLGGVLRDEGRLGNGQATGAIVLDDQINSRICGNGEINLHERNAANTAARAINLHV